MADFDIKDRIVKLIRIKASSLRPNPWNFRVHNEKQKLVLKDILAEVGIAGAVLVRQLDDGSYCLLDGHLRKEELGDTKIPALVTDLTEEESKKLLAVYDPLSALAETDKDAFARLVKDMDVKGAAMASLFSELAEGSKVLKEDDLELDIEEDGEEEVVEKEESSELQNSHVKMVQLYCTNSNIKEFEEMSAEAKSIFNTSNLTDTVFDCLRFVIGKIDKPTRKVEVEKMQSKKKKKAVEEEE